MSGTFTVCSYVFLVLINVHSLEGGTAVQRMSFPVASCAGLWSVSEWSRLYTACTGTLYRGCSFAVKEAAGEVFFFLCFKKLRKTSNSGTSAMSLVNSNH